MKSERRQATEGTEEGDRDRKVKKKESKAGQATHLNPWASKCVWQGSVIEVEITSLSQARQQHIEASD